MSMYVKPLSFIFANALHRVSANAQTNVWGKYYTFSLATLLPRGSQTSDGGYLMSSMIMGGTDYDYHIIKTDPTGTTPTSCAQISFTPSAAGGITTTADPYYNSWSGTVGSQSLTVTVASVTPTSSIQCSFNPCTTPSITTQPSNVTVCSTGTASSTVSSTAGPYQWQYNNGGSWQNVTNGTPSGFSYASGTSSSLDITTTSATAGSYQFQVTVGSSGCSVTSSTITATVPGATQGLPTGTQCSGTALNFSATPSSGATYAWTVTSPIGTS